MCNDTNDKLAVPLFDTDDWLARESARQTFAATLRPGNKAALFDVLAAAGVTMVTVEFDGVGDSGQIEAVTALNAMGEAALPDIGVALQHPAEDGVTAIRTTLPLAEAIERLAYDLLEDTHPGWEINAGAFGTFTFDVAARTLQLEHHERFEDTLDTIHDL